jgi:uncharacterized protein
LVRSSSLIVLADTGALYALIDRSDAWHKRVVEWWALTRREVKVPTTVLPEISYLLSNRLGWRAEEAFIRSLADHEFELESLEAEDIERAAELIRAYSDLPLGFVDASIVAISERLEIRELLTTDRRHFSIVRPSHTKLLSLLP